MTDPYNVLLSTGAQQDLEEAAVWYQQQQKGLGYDFALAFEQAIEWLESNPERYRTMYKSVRYVKLQKFPYNAFFRIDEQKHEVIIIALLHNKRGPDTLKKRLKNRC